MKGTTKVPLSVCVGLAVAILLDTAVQICWKLAAGGVPEQAGPLEGLLDMLKKPLFWGVIVMFLAQLANWMKVLGRADLSYAQPITSLSYVSVCVISVLFLHEVVTPVQWFGVLLVLVGVWFISRSEHSTVDEGAQ